LPGSFSALMWYMAILPFYVRMHSRTVWHQEDNR
jgi:hypothetical protein